MHNFNCMHDTNFVRVLSRYSISRDFKNLIFDDWKIQSQKK